MKIALVHEYLTQLGGAERVLADFLEIWPDATLHVLVYDETKTQGLFAHTKIKTSVLNKLPGIKHHPKLFLALMPKAIESFKFNDFDLVLSDSSSFAKGAKAKNIMHICYCHTPTRFLWTEGAEYLSSQPYPKIFKWVAGPVLSWLKRWDYKAAQRPNFYIANSRNVQDRIKRFYNRDSQVVYPPVDTELFKPNGEKQNYFLTASRLESYKKTELIIEAFNKLKLPLKVAGIGSQLNKLKALAGPTIEFLGRVTDSQLQSLYSGAKAFVFAAEEDAGIMLLEAQACGTPVIAYKAGGASELVLDGITGQLFDSQTSEDIINAVSNFDAVLYQSQAIRQHAMQFSKDKFKQQIKEMVEEKYRQFNNLVKE